MFTGLIQHVGTVASIEPAGGGHRIAVDASGWSHRPAAGASIAVDGCCLTVADGELAAAGRLAFDAIPQTMRETVLGDRRPGDPVNLEHSVTPETLLGGHLVQGHVDGTGRVVAAGPKPDDPDDWRVRIEAPDAVRASLVRRGSITVNGVSLTIAELDEPAGAWFEVALIPVTLRDTNLDGLRPGDRVNLESDVIARMVLSFMERAQARA